VSMHEQSETVQSPDGSWVNVYGAATSQAGKRLPGMPAYPSLQAAVAGAKARSEEFGAPGPLADFLHRAYNIAMTPLPATAPWSDEQIARLRNMARSAGRGLAGLLPSVPDQLPTMPDWMRRYAAERGLAPYEPPPGNPAQ